MLDWILAHASELAISAFTVFAMVLTGWTFESRAKRHLRAAESVRKDYTAARIMNEQAARLQVMREAAERADLIRVTTEQAGIALQAAKDAQHYADLADEILSNRKTDPALGGMAVMAADPDTDEAPDTERSGVMVAFPGAVRS